MVGKTAKGAGIRRDMGCSRLESADLNYSPLPRGDPLLARRQGPRQGHQSGLVEPGEVRDPRDATGVEDLGGSRDKPGHAEGPAGVTSKVLLREEAPGTPYKKEVPLNEEQLAAQVSGGRGAPVHLGACRMWLGGVEPRTEL